MKLVCAHCGKRLSRKTARQIDGVVMCSTCMFLPAKDRPQGDRSPQGGDGLSGSVVDESAGPRSGCAKPGDQA